VLECSECEKVKSIELISRREEVRKSAFLLIEILIACGIFATCSLAIALVNSQLLIHRAHIIKKSAELERERAELENKKVTFSSHTFETFLQHQGRR